jgi:hypothetical protein
MSIEITLIVLLAAMLNAGWNALIQVSGDRVPVMAMVTLARQLRLHVGAALWRFARCRELAGRHRCHRASH